MSGDTKLYLYFAAVKLAGYALACLLFAGYYQKSRATGALAGVVRTLIGLGTGGLLILMVKNMPGTDAGSLLFWLILIPLRVVEWGAVFWVFFGRPFQKPVVPMIALAICWSFVLDGVGAIFGIMASGIRIC